MVEKGEIISTVASGIATVTFAHPRGNSLPGELLRALAGRIETVSADPDVRVILLQSAGEKAFCAGASFDELLAVRTAEQSEHFFSGFAILISAMRRAPKFIVTRVQGKAVGGGVGIIAASDYVFAAESASLRLSELALGFGPFVIGPAVQRKIGVAAFGGFALDTDWRDAQWALRTGLYNQVLPAVDQLDAAVQAFSARLATYNPAAMQALKRVLWEGTDHWDELLRTRVRITGGLAVSEFVQSTVAALNR